MTMLLFASLSEIARSSRAYGASNFIPVVIFFIVVIGLITLSYYLVDRLAKRAQERGRKAKKPIRTIAQQLGLSETETQFLEGIKEHNALPVIEFLFVDPTLWRLGIERMAINPESTEFEQIRQVMIKVFDEQIANEYLLADKDLQAV